MRYRLNVLIFGPARIGLNALRLGGTVLLAVGLALLVEPGLSSASPSNDTGVAAAEHVDSGLPRGQIGHQGRWLVDKDDRVLLFHGINIVEKAAPYYPAAAGFSDADAAWLADNGLRVVRVGILATGLMPTPGVVDERYISHVAATVADLRRHGIYSLIDFHQDGYGPSVGDDGFPASMTVTGTAVNNHVGFPLYYIDNPAVQQAFQSFWDDAPGSDGKSLQSDYVSMFHAVAERFAHNPNVLGYDLFNEPWPGNVWQPCIAAQAGCPSLDNSELGPLYAKAVQGIRAAGDTHLIFGEPFVLFNFGLSTTSLPLPGTDPNSGMAFHMYTLDPTKEPDVLANAAAWSTSAGGALLNTEWGAVRTTTVIERQADELDAALVPWIFWSMGEVVNDLNLPPSGTNLTASTVSALVQPYPLAVAGTPENLTYSPTSSTLSFVWSTAKPDGGSYPLRTKTVFVAPSTVYPNGYLTTVAGGTVTSAPNAPEITVVNGRGSNSVTVQISPR
jgi:endoglycosylceramidase